MSEAVDVVSAVIVQGGRLLFAQRRADKSYPLTWETPGGKVEPGDRHAQHIPQNAVRHNAVRRECHEELFLTISTIGDDPIWAGEVAPEGSRVYYFTVWEVLGFTGTPRPREGQGFGWFLPHELAALNLAPGTGRAMAAIREVLMRRSV